MSRHKNERKNFYVQLQKIRRRFQKNLVNLYHGGKTQSSLCKEYGVSQTAISRWIKLYSEVEMETVNFLPLNKYENFRNKKPL